MILEKEETEVRLATERNFKNDSSANGLFSGSDAWGHNKIESTQGNGTLFALLPVEIDTRISQTAGNYPALKYYTNAKVRKCHSHGVAGLRSHKC